MASPTCFRFAKIVSARVERKHVFWIGEGYHHCARRTNAPSAPSARTFADMFRTTTFLAVFVALIASAQADLPSFTCPDLQKDHGCATVGAVFGTELACTSTANAAGAAGTCSWDDNACNAGSSANQHNGADWATTEQQNCGDKTTEATCGTTSCTWIATSAATNECVINTDSLIATLVAASGTTVQVAYTKSQFELDETCKPLYKDAATCNANAKCYYNAVTTKCTGSVAYYVANLAEAGCTTEAEAVATKYDTTVAASQAAVASGAAGFSSGAVILSALVA